jgi:hypothetical protein
VRNFRATPSFSARASMSTKTAGLGRGVSACVS